MFKKSLSTVGFGAVLLAMSSLISRLLGLVRDFVFARIFGVGQLGGDFALDAYFAAFRIPDLLYTLLIFGAMSAAFIPIYTELLEKGEKKASIFTSQILNLMLILLLVFSGLFWILAPYVVPLIAPGFDSDVLDTTVRLTRIMLLSPIFLGLSSVLQGVENAHKKFIGISLAPIVYNLSIIIAAWFFAPEFGVFALAWGVVIGAFLHFSVQVPGAFSTGFRYKQVWSLKGKAFKEFVTLTIPRIFGVMVSQFGIFIDTIIASLLALGSLSIYNYALNLQSLPHGIVAVSLSVAVFASLSEKGLKKDKSQFLETLKTSTHAILFWVFPAIVGLFLLRENVVDFILAGGAFDQSAAEMTVLTLGIFVWASLGQSLIPLFARSFYALHHTTIPVLIGFFSVLLNMSISLVLTQVYDFEVYALAISALVSVSLNAFFLIVFFSRYLKVSPDKFFNIKNLLLTIINTSFMGIVVLALLTLDYASSLQALALIGSSGFIVYLVTSKLTKTIPSLHGH